MTIGSDVEFKDIIIFNENSEATFIVSPGAILTVDESVTTVATREKYMNIIVSAGAKAIINGGTFASVGGEGTVVIGPKATVLSTDVKVNEAEKPEHVVKTVYLDGKNGDNAGDGKTPETAVRGYAAGAFKHITVGGTIVICGDSTIGGSGANNEYVLPSLAKTLTLTSVGGGVSYKETATLKFKENTLFTIGNDVVFDNIVLTEEKGQTTISVKNGAAVTFTDSAEFVSKKEDGSHYKLVLEKGTFAILSAKAKEALTVTGEGTVIDYVDGFSEVIGKYAGETKVVELTIGSPVAYVNGIANTLDAAPINRNSRTMLPVRFLANTFGISNDGIEWNDATKTATLKNDTTTIVITIGAPTMTVNGAAVALDSPAVIENSRTYLPVRVIANALGVSNDSIAWDSATNTATLVK